MGITGGPTWSCHPANWRNGSMSAGPCTRCRKITAAKWRSVGASTTAAAKWASSPRCRSPFAARAAVPASPPKASSTPACSRLPGSICAPPCATAPTMRNCCGLFERLGWGVPIATASCAGNLRKRILRARRSRCTTSAVESMTFTHLDADQRPTMVDVSGKVATQRSATAEARVQFPAAVAAALRDNGLRSPKGPVFDTAIVAGVLGAKRTHELIPFCHPLGIESCRIAIDLEGDAAVIRCSVSVHHKTRVEIEALTGAAIAALTVYDMCKGLSHDIVIGGVRLLSKDGGKSAYGVVP